jgi:MFS family permease
MIYLHHFFHGAGRSITYIFTGAYFLNLGMPLPFVLLFYGLEFGVRGALCPWGVSIFNKLGVIKGATLSVTLYTVFFIGLSYAEDNLYIGFGSLLFAALSGALYFPFKDVLEALYIEEDHNRTKQISMGQVLLSLGQALGAAGTGYLITHHGITGALSIAAFSLYISIAPLIFLEKNHKAHLPNITASDVNNFLLRKDFKIFWKPFFGEQLTIIVKIVIVPIFLSTFINGFDHLGYLLALALIAEKIFTLLSGHFSDKYGAQQTLKLSKVSYSTAMLTYILATKTPLALFLTESLHKISSAALTSAFISSMHTQARGKFPKEIMLFGTGWQMALCFGELLTLPVYALIAHFIGESVFYITFIGGIIGIWLMNHGLEKQRQ